MNISLELIISFLSGVVVPIIGYFIKTKRDKNINLNKDKIKEEVEFSSIIDRRLDAIKEEYNADRIWLCQFHNGGHFYPTGKSIQKFSMFYESVSLYAESIKLQFQNIPINLFTKSINELLINDLISVSDFSDPSIDNFGLQYVIEKNTKSLYIVSIRDIEGRFIGMLGMSFINKTELSDEELNEFMLEASRMGGEIIKYLKSK